MSDRAPDLIGRVLGYRAFKTRSEPTPQLISPYMGHEWESHRGVLVMHAGRHLNHDSPSPQCDSCGLYGLYTPDAALSGHAYEQGRVIAGCTFWGRIQVHPTGLRAAHCQVHALCPGGSDWDQAWLQGMSPGLAAVARADPVYFFNRYGDGSKPKNIAQKMGLIVCENVDELRMVMGEFGDPLPDSLKPGGEAWDE